MGKQKTNTLAELMGDALKKPVQKNIQKVVPLETDEKEKEVQFQFYLPEPMLDAYKILALKRKSKIKRVMVLALQEYLDKNP